MAVLRIRILGDPVLRRKCRAVDRITKEDRRLVDDMIETMEGADGAGLAAPQVGVTRRIIVVHDEQDRPTAIINPKLLSRSNEIVCGVEGCLSLPRLQAEVKRPKEAVVRGRGIDGKPIEITGVDIRGRALFHELDHLEGRLYIDAMEPDTLSWITHREDEETGEEEVVLEPTTVEGAEARFRLLAARRRR
jgi:peptide deformylase